MCMNRTAVQYWQNTIEEAGGVLELVETSNLEERN